MGLAEARERLRSALTGEVRFDEPMARHTSYRIGGPADVMLVCDTLSDLASAVTILTEEQVPWTVVGKGTNLLVADSGYRGAALMLGRDFKRHSIDGGSIQAGAATILAFLVQEAYANGMSGMEFAAGIPGTLGGALTMNAGTGKGSIGQVVESVTLFVPGSGLTRVHASEIGWAYRSSGLRGRGIIVEAVLRIKPGERERIRASMEVDFRLRKQSQPLNKPSAGSVFVNPEGHAAGRLIEESGLKGTRVGGARVSPVHANFIVNEGGASARDVLTLIRKVQMTIKDRYGIELTPEIRFLGSFDEP